MAHCPRFQESIWGFVLFSANIGTLKLLQNKQCENTELALTGPRIGAADASQAEGKLVPAPSGSPHPSVSPKAGHKLEFHPIASLLGVLPTNTHSPKPSGGQE